VQAPAANLGQTTRTSIGEKKSECPTKGASEGIDSLSFMTTLAGSFRQNSLQKIMCVPGNTVISNGDLMMVHDDNDVPVQQEMSFVASFFKMFGVTPNNQQSDGGTSLQKRKKNKKEKKESKKKKKKKAKKKKKKTSSTTKVGKEEEEETKQDQGMKEDEHKTPFT